MSRRSAVATDTGTTCATFARAEPGLGSLPPQLERYTQSNKMSPSDELARQWSCRGTGMTDGCRKVKDCAFPAASGLPEAVVIRRPLSEGKYDESDIIVVVLGSVPKGWTFKSQLRLRNIAARTERNIAGSCSYKINFILKQKKHLRSLQKITFVDPFFTLRRGCKQRLPRPQIAQAGVRPASRVYCCDFPRRLLNG
jgi:hypothetical protein